MMNSNALEKRAFWTPRLPSTELRLNSSGQVLGGGVLLRSLSKSFARFATISPPEEDRPPAEKKKNGNRLMSNSSQSQARGLNIANTPFLMIPWMKLRKVFIAGISRGRQKRFAKRRAAKIFAYRCLKTIPVES